MKLALLSTLILVWAATIAGCDTAPPPPTPPPEAGETITDVLKEPEPFTRVRELATLLPTLGPESVPEAALALRRAGSTMGASEFELLVRFWATQDPRAATEWVIKSAPMRFRPIGLGVAVELWARVDPAATVATVTSTAQAAHRETAQATQLALVRGWFQKDRPGLEQYIRGLGSSMEQQRALYGYAIALTQLEGSDSAMRWAEAIPEEDGRYKLAVYRQVTTALALIDPPAAERWCEAQCDGPYGRGLSSAMVRIRLHNGDKAEDILDWAVHMPEGESRNAAIAVTYEIWALRDRDAAMAWMAEQASREEPEPWLALLYATYARQLAVDSPAEGLKWAERVEHPAGREELLVRIARKWLTEDPKAAEAWLVQSPLSESARARARNLALPTYLPEGSAAKGPEEGGAEAIGEPQADELATP